MEEKVTLEIHMPKSLYDLVNELGKERHKDWEAIILDSVYLQVLTTMRLEKFGAWKKSAALMEETRRLARR